MVLLYPYSRFIAVVFFYLIVDISAFTYFKGQNAPLTTSHQCRTAQFGTDQLRKTCVSTFPTASSKLGALRWPTLPWDVEKEGSVSSDALGDQRNGLDDKYPWRFEGRFIFRPSLVRTSPRPQSAGQGDNLSNDLKADHLAHSPLSASLLSLFGYTLGGTVALEYDVSPVGPYTEYVTMGGIVGFGRGKEGNVLGIGQWGTDLYVSTKVAEQTCQRVWGVPAQVANINLVEAGVQLEVDAADEDETSLSERTFTIEGWSGTRILSPPEISDGGSNSKRYGGIPILWTPTIKALWAPFAVSLPSQLVDDSPDLLPVHRLRLSASALRIKRCGKVSPSERMGEIPLGLALVVDNALIEIGEEETGYL